MKPAAARRHNVTDAARRVKGRRRCKAATANLSIPKGPTLFPQTLLWSSASVSSTLILGEKRSKRAGALQHNLELRWRRKDLAAGLYHGVVRGETITLRESEPPLADSTEVLVTPLPPESGTAAAVLAAMARAPQVPSAWVDELEQLIAAGKCPPLGANPFADDCHTSEPR